MKEIPRIDTNYLEARPLALRPYRDIELVLVGCGGTGSHLAPLLAAIAAELIRSGRRVELKFIDFDFVEEKNLPRQNFTYGNIGRPKAEALALRYGARLGLPATAIIDHFKPEYAGNWWGERLVVLAGCVDNAEARKSISEVLELNRGREPKFWWVDSGNSHSSGQVLLGCAARVEELEKAFGTEGVCTHLPSPALQHPDLLLPRPEELNSTRLSCAELVAAGQQSLLINSQIASIAADYILRLVTGGLKRFATYFDAASMCTRSLYISPKQLASFGEFGAKLK